MSITNLPEEIILEIILSMDDDEREHLCQSNKRIAGICSRNKDYIDEQSFTIFNKIKPKCDDINFIKKHPRYKFPDGSTCLIKALTENAQKGTLKENSSKIIQIIKATKNINARDLDGQTALHIACTPLYDRVKRKYLKNLDIRIVKALVKAGADVNCKDAIGVSPLHYLAMYPDDEIIELLLKNGANPNFRDANDESPLGYALEKKNYGAIYFLLKYGANITNGDILYTKENDIDLDEIMKNY